MLLRCARARRRRMHLFLMARIVFHAMAYRGDVYPYVPVASELSRRGHEVAYVVPREFHASFSAEPFRCVHSGTDFGPLALDQYGDYLARWGMRLGGAMVLRLYFGVFTVPHLPELFDAIDDELADADLLVSHPAASMVGALSCERRGIPWIVGDLFPMLLPTDAAPPMPGLPNLGPRVNRKMWQIAKSKRLDGLSCGEGFRNFRRILGLSVPDDWNVIDARLSPHRNLGFVSKHYIDAQPGWPDNYELVGFTPWIGPNNGGLSDDVVEFLNAGEPPVIVTLGTLGASAHPGLFEHIAAALDRADARGLFLTSNESNAERLRGAGVGPPHGIWPFVPLTPLLRRCRAIVHSGAHGTNAMALIAGIPSVVTPCLFDQLWHARRQAELGTGLWVRRPSRLEAAIARLLDDESLTDHARALARRLADEDGTRNACDQIEAFLAA